MQASGPSYQNRENRDALLNFTSMATPQQQKPLFQEGRLILALNAYKQGQFLSLRSAVKIYSLVGWPGGLHGPLACRLRYNL